MTLEDTRHKLTARLDELLSQVNKIESDIRHVSDPLDRDSQERSVQLENEDVLEALDEAGRRELGQIRSALKRVANGTYGTCVRCGEAIAAVRLDALPATELCIGCAESSG